MLECIKPGVAAENKKTHLFALEHFDALRARHEGNLFCVCFANTFCYLCGSLRICAQLYFFFLGTRVMCVRTSTNY